MVAHRRLRQTHRIDEVADACLTLGRCPDQAQELEAGRIGEHLQRIGEPVGFLRSSGAASTCGQHSASIVWISFMEEILTLIDGTVNVSTAIDTKEVSG